MEDSLECTDGICLAPKGTEVEKADDEKIDSSDTKEEAADPNKKKHSSKKKPGSSNPLIQKVHTQRDMDALLASKDAVIVEFVTTWCGACKGIEPLFEELATENAESVACAQVVCDKNKETKKLAAAHGVQSYPVFVVFENRSSSQKWNGADRGKLEKAFEKLGGGGGKKGGKGGKKKGRR